VRHYRKYSTGQKYRSGLCERFAAVLLRAFKCDFFEHGRVVPDNSPIVITSR
jgi:hypothetical protein